MKLYYAILISAMYLDTGIVYYDKNDYDKALEYYNKSITMWPRPDAYYNIGIIYDEKQDDDKALEYYNKAIELKPDYVSPYLNIGAVYHHKQDYDKALEYYNKAIELKPDYEKAHSNMKLAYEDREKEKKCKQAQSVNDSSDDERFKEDIMQVVNACYFNLENIYSNYLKKKPGFSGKVMLKFTIASSGDIISISIVSSTTSYPEFDNAIKDQVAKWKWKAIKSGNTTPTIPFNFTE